MTKTSMKKVLSQEEIDSLIRAARAGPGAAAPIVEQPAVTLWDGRQARQIGQEHTRAINRLHQTFAHNLTHSLGAYLRIEFEAALVSGEHLTYGEFLQSIPEVTYLASFKLMPAEFSVLLQLDLAIAYPLIDLLLGGEGKGATPERRITEIGSRFWRRSCTSLVVSCKAHGRLCPWNSNLSAGNTRGRLSN